MIKIEITGENANEIFTQLSGLVGRAPVTAPALPPVSVDVEDEKPVETKKPATKKSPEKAKAPEKKPEETKPEVEDEEIDKTENTTVDGAAEESDVSYEDLQKAMLRLTKAYNLDRSKAAGILKHFGVSHGGDLKKSDYAEAYKMAEDLIAEAK